MRSGVGARWARSRAWLLRDLLFEWLWFAAWPLPPDTPVDCCVFVGRAFLGKTFVGETFLGGTFDGKTFLGGTFVGGTFVGKAFVGGAFVGGAFVGEAPVCGAFDCGSFVSCIPALEARPESKSRDTPRRRPARRRTRARSAQTIERGAEANLMGTTSLADLRVAVRCVRGFGSRNGQGRGKPRPYETMRARKSGCATSPGSARHRPGKRSSRGRRRRG
jgi:hypothetical protein